MDKNRHSVLINFLGAAGEVTPSSTLVQVRDRVTKNVVRIMHDAGSAIREETPDSKNLKSISIPTGKIHVIVLSHSHTDHVGSVPSVVQKHPNAPVLAPEHNKAVMRVMIQEAYARQKEREPLREIEDWREDMVELIGEMEVLEKRLARGVSRGKGGNRTKKTLPHETKKQHIHDDIDALELIESKIWWGLGLTTNSTLELYELLERDMGDERRDIGVNDLKEAVNRICTQRLAELSKQGIVTPTDVETSIQKIQELQLRKSYKIAKVIEQGNTKEKHIKATMYNSGHTHLVPSAQVLYEIPSRQQKTINLLFSGDRGNSQLKPPYAQADDTDLENKADVLILEATYGGRLHGDREKELLKLDEIVLEAIQKGEDIIIPIISLDRPIVVMYEIVMRLIKTGKIKPSDLDVSYFGQMISRLLSKRHNHPMIKEIKKYWGELTRDGIKKFSRKGKKTRIVFAGGGFLPRKGSPAGAILEYALDQDELTILSANFHGGPGSNGHNLFNGKGFQLTKENLHLHKLKPGQKPYYTSAFSGHDDGPGLVAYARKVTREGGTVFLNHGSEESRRELAWLLMRDPVIIAKKIKVVLPKGEKDYVVKKAKKGR